MDPETENLIANSFAKLPQELQKGIASLPLTDITQVIAAKNNLHVDQIGSLYMETLLVLLGLEKINNISANLQKELGVNPLQAQNIVNELNEKVFKLLRKSLQESQSAQNPTSESINTERSRTLDEIENPTPTIQPISSSRPQVPEIPIPKPTPRPWESAKNEIAKNFISGKLTESTNNPPERTSFEMKNGPQKSTDPYREMPL